MYFGNRDIYWILRHVAQLAFLFPTKRPLFHRFVSFDSNIQSMLKNLSTHPAAQRYIVSLSILEQQFVVDFFPKVYISYILHRIRRVRICSVQQLVSKLKLVKTKFRCVFGESKFVVLMILSTKSDLSRKLSFDCNVSEISRRK